MSSICHQEAGVLRVFVAVHHFLETIYVDGTQLSHQWRNLGPSQACLSSIVLLLCLVFFLTWAAR